MGNDKTVVNAARVSFDMDYLVDSSSITAKDISLIQFLARGCSSKDWDDLVKKIGVAASLKHTDELQELLTYIKRMPLHWTPFGHCVITLRETLPIFIARQRTTHHVGIVYNEVSRRYVDDTPQIYTFNKFRSRPSQSIKQGSGETHPRSQEWVIKYQRAVMDLKQLYNDMIEDDIAPEQARAVLPMSMMTTYWVTGSLYSFANAYNARSDSHAQKEIQAVAQDWKRLIEPLYPIAWKSLTE